MFASLTAIPIRSQSGSVPNTISAFNSLANSIPKVKASLSSGFGDLTVEKSPSSFACSSTSETQWNPSFSNILETGTLPEPCNGVYTIFKLFFIISFFIRCCLYTSETNSSVLSIKVSNVSFPSKSIE